MFDSIQFSFLQTLKRYYFRPYKIIEIYAIDIELYYCNSNVFPYGRYFTTDRGFIDYMFYIKIKIMIL